MKYSISARQPLDLLKQAEEIAVEYKDLETLFNYEEWSLTDKEIVIHIYGSDVDWELLSSFKEKMPKLSVRLENLSMGAMAKEYNIPYFWHYIANDVYEIKGLLENEVSQIMVGIPAIFNLPYIKSISGDVKLRIIPNRAYEGYIKHKNGIVGGFVRPEDIPYYEPYIDVCEFHAESLKQQKGLFDIYHNDKKWPGNLSILITNLDYNIDNRIIPNDFAENRLNCKQKCQQGYSCHLCENIFKYISNADHSRFDWDFKNHTWIEENN